MPKLQLEGLTIHYEVFGHDEDPLLVLVSGFTSQLTSWPEAFCQALVDRGFRVVRFDNRDCGLSTALPEGATYTMSDMAADVGELICALTDEPAHVVGISMGGMIVQTLAAERPDLVASMTSYASTTSNPEVGGATAAARELLLAPPATTREEAIAAGVAGKRIWGTPDTWVEEEFAAFCGDNWDRAHPEGGAARQWAAMAVSGDRSASVATITCPSLVIHGDADTLIDVSGGRHTAELIEGAEYVEVEGMGHDLPITEWPMIVERITALAARSHGG